MPKRNYGNEKRQKELNRQRKQEEKRQRRAERAEARVVDTEAETLPPDSPTEE